MSNRILVVTQQGEARFLTTESAPTRVITIQPTGARGIPGTTGAGVAAGGSANDILKKTSGTNYATEWETPTSAATANTIVRRDETGGAFFGGDVGAPKYRGNFYQAESATDGASLRNSSGTAILTWGATAGNISITVDTTSTGHFFSNPGTATAGHFITKNGTAPTITAGRSAWFSNSSGSPQFKNGTSSAITLIYNGGALGTPSSGTLTNCTGLPIATGISDLGLNVATFLISPNAANFQNMILDYTGTGNLVMENGPVITNININTAATFNATTYTYQTGAAAAHRTALGLTALATTTPGTGVATALAVNVGTAGAFVVNGGPLGTPSSGTLTSCTGLPISTGVSGLGTGVATLLAGTPSGTGGPVGTTSPTISNPTASTASSSSAALLVSGPTSGVDTLRIQGTTTASYSSIGFIDSGGTQRGSFGYAGTTAGSFSNTTFINAANGVPLTLGTNSTERIRIASSGGVSIGTTTDAGATNLLVAGSTKSNGGFIYGTFTVGTFPSTTYLEAVVTDALTPVIGATVAAGGSAKCKVMYNGSAKIVTAVL